MASLRAQVIIFLTLFGVLPLVMLAIYLVIRTTVTPGIIITPEQLLGYVLIAMPIIFIISITAAYLLSKRFSKPIKDLTESIEKITKGKFDVELKKSNISEIQSLSNSLERILSSLKLAILRAGLTKEDIGLGEALKAKERAETALRESEERLSSIFEAATDGIAYIDTTGNIITVNKKAEEITGYKKEELLGKNFTELGVIDPKEIPEFLNVMEKSTTSGKGVKNFELTILRKDKKKLPIEISTGVVKKDDKIVGISAVIRDISERKAVQEALHESEEKLSSIFDAAADDFIVHMDASGNILKINKASERVFGRTQEEIAGKNFTDLSSVDQKEIPRLLDALSEMIKTGESVKGFETILIDRNRRKFPAEINVSPIKKQGKVIALAALTRDISDRKKAEQEIRESEEQLKILFEYAPDAIYLMDLKGNFIDGNRAAENLVGHKKEELIGKSFTKLNLLSKKDLPKGVANLAKNALGKPTGPDEFTLNRKDGSKVTAEIRTFPVKVRGKTLVLGIARDITERTKTEKEVRESEEKYRILAETSSEGIFTTDKLGNLTYTNPELEKMFGYSPKETLNTHFSKYITKTSALRAIKLFTDLARRRVSNVKNIELEAIHKDKHKFTVEVSASPLIKDKKFEGVECIVRDVSERKKSQKEIEDAKNFYEGMLNTMSDSVLIMDSQAKVIKINKAEERVVGYKEKELLGKVAFNISKPEDTEKQMKMLKETLEKGRAGPIENTIVTKDGREIPASTTMSALKDAKGNLEAIFTVTRDISELKKAEKDIRLFSDAVEASYDNIILTDLNGNVTYANQATCKAFGYTTKELVGKHVTIFTPNPADATSILKDVIKIGHWRGEVMAVKKNKKQFPVIASIALIRDEKRKAIATMAIFRDIAEQKKIEKEVKESEERYRNIFELSPDGIITLDLEGNVTAINTAFSRQTGYKKDEIVGKSFAKLPTLNKAKIPQYIKRFDALLKGSVPEPFEESWVHKNGSIHYGEYYVSLLKVGNKISGIQVITRDITESKKTQDAIKESEEKYRSIIESANALIMAGNSKGQLTIFNKAYEDLTGYKKNEVLGKPFTILVTKEEHKKHLTTFQNVFNNKHVKNYEITIISKKGEKKKTLFNSALIKDKDGNPIVVGIGYEIREE